MGGAWCRANEFLQFVYSVPYFNYVLCEETFPFVCTESFYISLHCLPLPDTRLFMNKLKSTISKSDPWGIPLLTPLLELSFYSYSCFSFFYHLPSPLIQWLLRLLTNIGRGVVSKPFWKSKYTMLTGSPLSIHSQRTLKKIFLGRTCRSHVASPSIFLALTCVRIHTEPKCFPALPVLINATF